MKNPGSASYKKVQTAKLDRVGSPAAAALFLVFLLSATMALMGCTGITTASQPPAGAGSGNNPSGTPIGMLVSTPGALSFGSLPVGSQASQSATVTNTGKAAVMVSQIAVNGKGFGLQSPGSATFSIATGQTVSVQVQFMPQAVNAASGTLSIVSDAANSPLTVSLSGVGQATSSPSLSATPASATFPNVPVGTGNTQTITLLNTGNSSVTISRGVVSGTGFGLQGLSLPLVIPAGGNASFNATFTPASSGNASGSITLASNAPNSPLTIMLAGTGEVATHLLGTSTQIISFGSIAVGNTESHGVTLTNTGNSDVTISAVKSPGTAFSVSGVTAGTRIAPGQAAVLDITFDPHTPGPAGGTVTVASNATNSPAISVSGTGVQPSPHSVALSWEPSSSNVAGYFVYRGVTPGGPYSRLNASPDVPTIFTDLNVQSGHTYVYVVTAVDSNSVESPPSNEVTAAVPAI